MPTAEPITSDLNEIAAMDQTYVMGNYARRPVAFVRGEGARLWDSQGREYLDFLAGIAVCSLGHSHAGVAKAISDQAHKLTHISNLFHNEHQAQLAQRLTKLTGMDKAFFCNSGAEANEAAIKIARKWGKKHKGDDCFEIITFTGSFHGRTLATVTATAQPKYQEPFKPLPEGFKYVPFGDLHALDEAITEQTCAVMIEPIQGESGVNIATPEFLSAVRALCDEAGILLILDEVQCGTGRTGSFLASQRAGVSGDVVTLAKAIANGFPMGVCLARGDAANTLVPGDHGSTFGGQPLACAAALAVLDALEGEGIMESAATVGEYFLGALCRLQKAHPDKIKVARGLGLMVALEFSVPIAKDILNGLFERGVIANAVSEFTLRFVPPLVVTLTDCDRVVSAIAEQLGGE